jgi:hypothetical protein
LQFGPDGRLYVSQQNGSIQILTIERRMPHQYHVTKAEIVDLVRMIPNHDDKGKLSAAKDRQVTGILATGTKTNPMIYVTSSDIRVGGQRQYSDICTNSGIISRLTWSGSKWVKLDLVRGLPRSTSNHSTNGMQLDSKKNILYVASGGLTNAGSPSVHFGFHSEYALSAAILAVDLNAIAKMPVKGSSTPHPYIYDLPTLDDPTRRNRADGSDEGDPFGGNAGLNQAKIVPGGPVQIFVAGFRNAYDLVITKTPGRERRMYTVDNGPNIGWGGFPDQEGPSGRVTNRYVPGEPGSSGPGISEAQIKNLDALFFIGSLDSYVPNSFYGGHPNPIRANPPAAGLFTPGMGGSQGVWRRSKNDAAHPLPSDWPPVPLQNARPVEGDYLSRGKADRSFITFAGSTNGITEYTASIGKKAMQGDLLVASFRTGIIHRIRLNQAGNAVLNKTGPDRIDADMPFASGFGNKPLDITAQGDNDIFPGTVWVAVYGSNRILVFEPETASCLGAYNLSDEDRDKYSNQDEIDNKTDPCSAANKPQDYDRDFLSDLNDPDDDNDRIPDTSDVFAIDPQNGHSSRFPVRYDFTNDTGVGLFGLGFTGLMSNGKTDYRKLFNEDNLIAGAAAGVFTIERVTAGDALGSKNSQENAFQFGIKLRPGMRSFAVKTRLLGPFFHPEILSENASQGFYIGTGDQDNYLKMALTFYQKKPVIVVVIEISGKPIIKRFPLPALPASTLDLLLWVEANHGKVQPRYSMDGGRTASLDPLTIQGDLLKLVRGERPLAVGLIATSGDPRLSFSATWDFVEVSRVP